MVEPSIAEALRDAFVRARDHEGSINERLALYADAVRRLDPSGTAIVDDLVHRLSAGAAGEGAPAAGEPMPPFMLPDESGRMVMLADVLARGPAVIAFHRGHWCPYCRISINALARAQNDIERRGGRIVAIVPERAEFVAQMRMDSNVRFPILTDMDNGYALSLNLAIWIGHDMIDFMSRRERKLPLYQGNDSWMLPIPATFVVGQDGKVRARFVDPDYRRRMDIDALLDALLPA